MTKRAENARAVLAAGLGALARPERNIPIVVFRESAYECLCV